MKLSVVIPVHNGGADLRACLSGLAQSTRKPDEIIVVDDGSTDGSAACAAEASARVIALGGPPRGPAFARNRGAEAATGEILIFVDADVVVHPKTVEQFEKVFRGDPGVAAAFGSYDDQPPAEGRASRFKNLLHHFVHQHGPREAETFWAGCGAIRRKIYLGVGGFSETYARPSIEDIELGGRLRAAGQRIVLCPEILCTHRKRWTLVSLLRTDIFSRAVPWTKLILGQGRLPAGLNTDRRSRWSAALALLMVLGLLSCLASLALHRRFGAAASASLGLLALLGVTRLNAELYRFFFQHGDRRFGVVAVALHVLYLLYSSLVFALLFGLHRLRSLAGGSDTPTPTLPIASSQRKSVAGGIVFLVLFAAYVGNGESLPGNDATPNTHLAAALLSTGSLSFTPDAQPRLFTWKLLRDDKRASIRVYSWDAPLDGRTAGELRKQGRICMPSAGYFLAKTTKLETYVPSYGAATGLFALPFVAAVYPFVPDLPQRNALLWFLCKLAAAFAVAGSAWFLFMVAAEHLRLSTAIGLTLLYGLGTCVWSVSSQTLWQHGPAEFFLAMGTFALFRRDRGYAPYLAGAAYALAFLCRPSNSVVVIVGFMLFLVTDWRKALRYLAGGLPFAACFLAYNLHFFHRPIMFGQISAITDRVSELPVETLWKTSMLEGMAGVLISPARGLFMYSPIFLLSMWAVCHIWKEKRWLPLRAVAFAVLGLWLIAGRWFGWWGGWCYGYRLVVDSAILLAFLAIPIAEAMRIGWRRKSLLAVLAVWSIGVQFLGVYAYDVWGWNNREGFEVAIDPEDPRVFDTNAEAENFCRGRGCTPKPINENVDRHRFHYRLWDIRESEILYYLLNLEESHQRRIRYWRDFVVNEG